MSCNFSVALVVLSFFFVTLISEFLSSLSRHLPRQPAPRLHIQTYGAVHKMYYNFFILHNSQRAHRFCLFKNVAPNGSVIPGQSWFHSHWTGSRGHCDRGYFFLHRAGVSNNNSNSYLQRGKLFVAMSGI